VATLKQTSDNDIAIVNGAFVIVDDPAEEAATVLRNKFLFGKGEYFLDTREGVPYFQYIFIKNPDVLIVRRLFSEIIRKTPGVKGVISMSVTRTADRKAKFSFRARAINGKIISGGSDSPFIVEP
jgi:hypothetical protein